MSLRRSILFFFITVGIAVVSAQANAATEESEREHSARQDDTRRPWSIKQRIMSRHGHLSNAAAADATEQIVSADLRQLYLGHLSGDCNRPEIAHRTVSERLQRLGATHVNVTTASQETPCATLTL